MRLKALILKEIKSGNANLDMLLFKFGKTKKERIKLNDILLPIINDGTIILGENMNLRFKK